MTCHISLHSEVDVFEPSPRIANRDPAGVVRTEEPNHHTPFRMSTCPMIQTDRVIHDD